MSRRMRVLVVFCHPRRDSFTGAVADALIEGLSAAGHEMEFADLYREGFDPVFGAADWTHVAGGGALPAAVRREQVRIERAAGLALVFPVWWWSFPALLKGWVDRVFSPGWAFEFTPERSCGLLANRPTLLLAPAGVRAASFRKYGYEEAMATQLDIGTLGYCGLRDIAIRILYDVNEGSALLRQHLDTARDLGRRFATWSAASDKPGAERLEDD